MTDNRALFLRVSTLSERSQVSKQLIHYYLRRGYLHPPIYKKGNQAYYDETHLERLLFIKSCKNDGIPLPFTVDLWERRPKEVKPDREHPQHQKQKKNSPTREQIIALASQHFLKKGYQNTSISEIMEAVGTTKPSFYYYFENKQDLYLTCLSSTFEDFSIFTMDKIRQEKDPLERIRMRWGAANTYTTTFLTAINLLKEALRHDDEEERKKAEMILRETWVNPIIKDLERGIQSGVFRQIDCETVAFALISITETLAYRGIIKQKHLGEAILNSVTDLVLHGLLNRDNDLKQAEKEMIK